MAITAVAAPRSERPSLAPYPEITILDCISQAVRERPHHPAILFKGRTLSYGELDRLSDAFATGLLAHGVRKGDRVAILLPNCPQFLIAELGVWKAGGIVAAMNPLYTTREMEELFRAVEPACAVALSAVYAKVAEMKGRTPLRLVISANIKEFLPPLLRMLFTVFKEKKEGHRADLAPGDLRMSDMLRQYAGLGRPSVTVRPDDDALILFTGGTTGVPKGAVGTHRAMVASGMQLKSWFEGYLEDWNDVLLQLMPLFHVYGSLGVSATALVGHHPLAMVPNPRDLDDIVHTIGKVKPAFVPGVPTLFSALLNHKHVQSGKVSFKSVKLCICGAAPLMTETKDRFEKLTGGKMVEGYALTESMMASVLNPPEGPVKPGSIGLPLPDVDVRIVHEETGVELPPNESGELLLRAPQMMRSYWNATETDEGMLRDGWLHTGDIAYKDDDGYLFIVDRAKDVIKPSGFQVWPREVEEIIAAHPAVAEVAVAGIPDAIKGEAVKAWIVVNPGAKVTPDEVRDFCRERMAGYKVPAMIEFRDGLPKSHIGKILRRALRAEPAAGH